MRDRRREGKKERRKGKKKKKETQPSKRFESQWKRRQRKKEKQPSKRFESQWKRRQRKKKKKRLAALCWTRRTLGRSWTAAGKSANFLLQRLAKFLVLFFIAVN
jgi:hypothetical protein